MSAELWRQIDGWAGYYEVSSRGRVRSVARVVVDVNGHRRRVPGRLLKLVAPQRGSSGGSAPRCTLTRPGERVTYYPRPLAANRQGAYRGLTTTAAPIHITQPITPKENQP